MCVSEAASSKNSQVVKAYRVPVALKAIASSVIGLTALGDGEGDGLHA